MSDINNKISIEEKKILKERAIQLARQKQPKKETEEITVGVLLFQLAGEIYGFETTFVKEVINLKEITLLPLAPRFVKGVINVRGEIISVLDLKVFFELPEAGMTDQTKVIILSEADMIFGVLADRIQEVKNISLKELHSNLTTVKGIREEYLKGVAEEFVILDARKIINGKNIIVYEEI